jgi:hypothetical protein
MELKPKDGEPGVFETTFNTREENTINAAFVEDLQLHAKGFLKEDGESTDEILEPDILDAIDDFDLEMCLVDNKAELTKAEIKRIVDVLMVFRKRSRRLVRTRLKLLSEAQYDNDFVVAKRILMARTAREMCVEFAGVLTLPLEVTEPHRELNFDHTESPQPESPQEGVS